jgi:SHS2 domain-containing protein
MTEPRFRRVETTADAGLLVWGDSSPDLFENAACGLSRVIAGARRVKPLFPKSIQALGVDTPGLLVSWLSEWLCLFDTEGFLGAAFQIDTLGGGQVQGTGWGETCDPGRRRLLTEVKGITYHRLEIRRLGKRLRARLVLDL